MTPFNARRVSRLFLAAGVLVAVTFYVALLAVFNMQVRSGETVFGAAAGAAHLLYVELDLFDLDPVRLEATLRVTVTPGPDMRGVRASAPDRDVLVVVQNGEVVHDLAFAANQSMATRELRVDLEQGSVLRYPFDGYGARLNWRGFEGTPRQIGASIPLRFHTYETSPIFDALLRAAPAVSAGGEVGVQLDARRPIVIRWFASAIYLSMVAVGTSALLIGGMMFLRRRRVESTLLGALCAMMFAVPVMRNTLPGSPPLGVAGDLLIFIWAEVAVVVGLCLGVASWARDGLRPDG